ncbi:M23 family metallopeptidase [Pseudonocardiaceae bacterium YIM PH 21723]|nr:M23 family metallopeptidase [Pseudonocardiaceae bacterium YIM PH 21723]
MAAQAEGLFAFPFATGQSTYAAGTHTDTGRDGGVQNAIDFTPSDYTVRASMPGTVHMTYCSGGPWVRIDHADGWNTGYYHLENIQVSDGQWVNTGQVLGKVGNALPCGGYTTGPHVHFTVWRYGNPVDLNGLWLSSWRIETSNGQYGGSLTKNDGHRVGMPSRFQAY